MGLLLYIGSIKCHQMPMLSYIQRCLLEDTILYSNRNIQTKSIPSPTIHNSFIPVFGVGFNVATLLWIHFHASIILWFLLKEHLWPFLTWLQYMRSQGKSGYLRLPFSTKPGLRAHTEKNQVWLPLLVLLRGSYCRGCPRTL